LLQRILARFRKPACCDDCCSSCSNGGCNSCGAAPAIHGPAAKPAEPIGAPKEQPKEMPKGAGIEPPMKFGTVAAPQLEVTPVSETKTPY